MKYSANLDWPVWDSGNKRWAEVPEPDECFAALHERLVSNERTIKQLTEINKRMMDRVYESEELQKMKEERDKAKEDLSRGFPISEKENDAIKEWIQKHMKEKHSHYENGKLVWNSSCAAGGRFEYKFCPTGLGTIGVVKCDCGKEFCSRELN